ncbi:MAG: lysophospholipid acyltransferase family protein [Thermomicrobiales bacterium]
MSGHPARDRGREEFGDLTAGTMQGVVFWSIRTVLLGLLRLLIGLKINGLENIPKSGGVLIVANHLHNADPVAIAVACTRPIHYMGKRELFEVPVIRSIIRFGGTFPIDRGHPDRWAIRRSEETLKQGIVLGMFPEGTRSKTGAMKEALAGAGLIGLRSNSPILPVAVMGTERLPFNGKRPLGRAKGFRGATVIFGEPFDLPREVDGKRLSADDASALMMHRIAELLPSQYRGAYGDPPGEIAADADCPGHSQ